MKTRSYTKWLFVLPAVIVVAALFIYPIFSSLFFSMTSKNLIRPRYNFLGLKNYQDILSDPKFKMDCIFLIGTDIGRLHCCSGLKSGKVL